MSFVAHTLVEFTGTWSYADCSNESWAFGVRLSKSAPDWGGLDNPGDWIATNGPALKTWFTTAANGMANTAKLGLIKCNNIDALGHYAEPVTHSYDAGGALGGASATLPVMLTAAITWGTGRSSGRARHGRIYPPCGLGLPSGGATVGGTNLAALLVGGKALLTALHQTSPLNPVAPTPVVCSKIDGSINPITQVGVGQRIDVQRRRSRQVSDARTMSNWP